MLFCSLKDTYHAFLVFQWLINILVHVKRSWKLKMWKSAPTEAPLSHRKHRSWNASSVALPLIPRLCDITVHHGVTRLQSWWLAASLARENWFSPATLLLMARVRADQSEESGALKRQALNQSFYSCKLKYTYEPEIEDNTYQQFWTKILAFAIFHKKSWLCLLLPVGLF